MLSKSVIKEIGRMAIGVLVLYVVMLLIFLVAGYFDSKVVLGGLLGSIYAIINFVLLGFSVEKSVGKGTKGAQATMGTSYTLRLILTAAVVLWAIKAPYFNYVATAIPLVFPRIVIYVLTFIDSKKGGQD
ncbi:MAG: ATP synthase subunit I [Clostridia bacterium]|nr:ATP synthase subunit I [Clostridia bacterium]